MIDADASQTKVIEEVRAGASLVVQGPPGTGKSQTITNLLTRAVAEGKRVLFVAEKRAALDVVARRLDAVGMGMFALILAPYTDRNPSNKPSDRKYVISLMTFFIMFWAVLVIIGSFFRGPGFNFVFPWNAGLFFEL